MNDIQNNPNKKRGWGLITLTVVLLFVMPILYVLSVGPALALFIKMGWSQSIIETLYAPLIWFLQNNPYEKELIEWYLWYIYLFVDV